MNTAQRDLLAKTLADIAKGIVIAVFIAIGTNKMDLWWGMVTLVNAPNLYFIAHKLLAGGDQRD